MSFSRILVLAALPLLTAGCGGNENLATVAGTVTLDGEPLPNAFITFIPQGGTGSPSYGRTGEDGYYEMMFSDEQAGAWVGENLVRISTADVGVMPGQRIPEKVPPAYNRNSELTRTVKPGDNEFNFNLKRDAGKTVQPPE